MFERLRAPHITSTYFSSASFLTRVCCRLQELLRHGLQLLMHHSKEDALSGKAVIADLLEPLTVRVLSSVFTESDMRAAHAGRVFSEGLAIFYCSQATPGN